MATAVLVGCLAARGASLPETCKPSDVLLKAIHDEPSARVYDAVGAWFGEHGDLKCAVAAFEEAIRIEPHSAEAHYDLGAADVGLNRLQAAAAEFRLALKAMPDMLPAHNSLGAVLLDLRPGREQR